MPPLECVGKDAKKSNPLSTAKPASKDADDSDDDMPPLEYVGKNAGKKETSAQPPPRASAKDADDSDDSMPPLEFVGTSSSKASEKLKVGDEVMLHGLSKANLNGQRAVVVPTKGKVQEGRL